MTIEAIQTLLCGNETLGKIRLPAIFLFIVFFSLATLKWEVFSESLNNFVVHSVTDSQLKFYNLFSNSNSRLCLKRRIEAKLFAQFIDSTMLIDVKLSKVLNSFFQKKLYHIYIISEVYWFNCNQRNGIWLKLMIIFYYYCMRKTFSVKIVNKNRKKNIFCWLKSLF